MRLGLLRALTSSLLLISVVPAIAALPRVHRGPTSPRLFKERTKPSPKPATHAIDSERATQIQTALVKSGYMTGSPSGVWDGETQAAMQKMQADNGWQTKMVPDSRAIIKLGLGSSNPAPQPAGNGAAEGVRAESTAEPATATAAR